MSTCSGLKVAAPISLCAALLQPVAAAQPIFRCGKTYTNVPAAQQPAQARSSSCTLVDTVDSSKGKPQRVSLDGSRQVTIPVGQDGKFWIRGSINGIPVVFAIDRNPTVHAGVAVTEALATRANLIGGSEAHVQTTGGIIDGRRLDRVPVTIGPFRVPQATVVVAALPEKSADALLGPELLSLFDVAATDTEMTIVGK